MRTFWILLKKEIKELITIQLILPIILIVIVFFFIGDIINHEREKSESGPAELYVFDLSSSESSRNYIIYLENSGFTIKNITSEEEFIKTDFSDNEVMLKIPADFESNYSSKKSTEIEVFSKVNNLAFSATTVFQETQAKLAIINNSIGSGYLAEEIGSEKSEFIQNPIIFKEKTIINEKQADVNVSEVIGYISAQTTFIPIVLFLVITLASQLVATSIASEKENKTLETLLSCPINRKSIVAAKLLSAGLISLLFASAYLFSMNKYMTSITGQSVSSISNISKETIFAPLGLTFSPADYMILGVSIFLGILGGLAIAFILGSLASDAKSAQATISPLMIMLLIPYILSILVDITALPVFARIPIYLIPFTHIFQGAGNILMGRYNLILLGDIYLLFFVLLGIFLAGKLIGSEKILTFKIDFSRFKKKR